MFKKGMAVLIFLFFLSSSCGYKLEKGLPGLNPNWRSLYICVWNNPTAEIRLGHMISEALRERFSMTGFWHLVSSPEKAQLILKGEIISLKITSLSYNIYTNTLEREIYLKAQVKLVETSNSTVLWEKTFYKREVYPVEEEQGLVDIHRPEALEQLARDISDLVCHWLSSLF